jgi:hypothetical protein
MTNSRKNRKTYNEQEIGVALNNAVAAALRPESLGHEVPDARLRKLREYALAVVEAPLEHVEEGLLTAEELVAILSVGSLFVHLHHVLETDRLPFARLAVDLYENEKVENENEKTINGRTYIPHIARLQYVKAGPRKKTAVYTIPADFVSYDMPDESTGDWKGWVPK